MIKANIINQVQFTFLGTSKHCYKQTNKNHPLTQKDVLGEKFFLRWPHAQTSDQQNNHIKMDV